MLVIWQALLIIILALSLLIPCAWAQLLLLDSDQQRYPIENSKISESSGLACSTRNNKLLWTHNDSGHMQIIYALDNTGRDLGTYYLDTPDNFDWEDMDAFEYQGEHYLLIADTGDNFKMRWDYRILIIKEPKPQAMAKGRSPIAPAWSFVFRFKNNDSYDIEAVAVDIKQKKILLLSKRTAHAVLFELPLFPAEEAAIPIAKKIAEFKDIVKASALDISADGRLLSINTYGRVHRFHKDKVKNRWLYDHSLKYRGLFQPEAMCLSQDEQYYYISSERKPYLLRLSAH